MLVIVRFDRSTMALMSATRPSSTAASAEDIRRLTFIRRAKDLGFDIAAIKTMLGLQDRPEASCEQVSRIATDQPQAVESRIRRLLGLRTELTRMIKKCDNGKVAACRIIEVLADSPGYPDDP